MHKIVGLVFGVSLLLVQPLFGQTDLSVKGSGKLYPIAMPKLCRVSFDSTTPIDPASEIPKVLSSDLSISGLFEVLNSNSYIENEGKCEAEGGFAYSDWSVLGAEGLVKGEVEVLGRNVKVKLYLHDVLKQRMVLGKVYEGDISNIPKIAHRFGNEIVKFFTGEAGVFGTQIVFSSKIGRFKDLFLMDMDGTNLKQLTDDHSLNLSPSWSPNGRKLVFTSFKNRIPDLYVMELGTSRRIQVTKGPPLEISPKFDRAGQQILVSRSSGSEAELLLLGEDGSFYRRLTGGAGSIDVSPSWSPDNSEVAFCSNRSGNPQIYVMNSDGTNIRRISFVDSNYCTSPAWSPKGDKIAFVCRADASFNIFTAKPDGTGAVQLTSVGANEEPTWSPDGRYIAFSSTLGLGRTYKIALMMADGSNVKQLTYGLTNDVQPSWGPRIE